MLAFFLGLGCFDTWEIAIGSKIIDVTNIYLGIYLI
jgi:hypothetical protein